MDLADAQCSVRPKRGRCCRPYSPRQRQQITGTHLDQSRAEELAVEVFLRLWRHPELRTANVEAWLYRVAVRVGLVAHHASDNAGHTQVIRAEQCIDVQRLAVGVDLRDGFRGRAHYIRDAA